MHPLHYLGHDAGRPTSCLRSSVQHVEDFVQALTQSAQRCLGVVDAAEAERLREEATKWRGRAEAEAKATMEAKGRKHERTQAIWADHLYDVRLRFVMRTCFLALHREVLREGRRRPSQGQGEEGSLDRTVPTSAPGAAPSAHLGAYTGGAPYTAGGTAREAYEAYEPLSERRPGSTLTPPPSLPFLSPDQRQPKLPEAESGWECSSGGGGGAAGCRPCRTRVDSVPPALTPHAMPSSVTSARSSEERFHVQMARSSAAPKPPLSTLKPPLSTLKPPLMPAVLEIAEVREFQEERLAALLAVLETRRAHLVALVVGVRRRQLMRLCMAGLRAHAAECAAWRGARSGVLIAAAISSRRVAAAVFAAWRLHTVRAIEEAERVSSISAVISSLGSMP